jgi:antitoxin ParD1/3/4
MPWLHTTYGGVGIMTTINISLPDSMWAFVEQKVAQGGYSTASEDIRQLVREDQKRVAKERLEALLIEGIESGPSVEITSESWAERKAELLRHLEKQGT